MYSFPNLEPVCCSISGSNCSFLICIQISQEAGKVVWYFHLFKNFPQFAVTHIVKDLSAVDEADVFLEFSCFFYDPTDPNSITITFGGGGYFSFNLETSLAVQGLKFHTFTAGCTGLIREFT